MEVSDLGQKTDEQVVAESLHKPQAYAELVLRYGEKLRRYIRRLGNLNPEDVNDILQNIFIKVYVNLNGFDRKLKFSSWVYRIAHNETVSFLRQKSSRPKLVYSQDEFDYFDTFISDLDLQKEAQIIFDSRKIAQVLAGMEREYREILVLKYFEQKDYAEISDILQKPMGSVASQLSRAKEKFRAQARQGGIKF
ncbi:MAG: RNA polymerase sigma factor [Candidatus Paceibacterota bacterium]